MKCDIRDMLSDTSLFSESESNIAHEIVSRLRDGEKALSLDTSLYKNCYDLISQKFYEIEPRIKKVQRSRFPYPDMLEHACYCLVESTN